MFIPSESTHLLQARPFSMAPSPRLSDKELANINAAAVTREYSVKPHIGRTILLSMVELGVHCESIQYQITEQCPLSMGKFRSDCDCTSTDHLL